MRYALCVFTVPNTDSIGGANQFLGGFLFIGRMEIQDPRPDPDDDPDDDDYWYPWNTKKD